MDEHDELDWGALFDLYRALALRVASGILGAREGAEDVVQEAARSVLARMRAGEVTFTTEAHARNYLLRAVHNLAVGELRRRGTRSPADVDRVPEPADPAPDPHEVASECELERLRFARDGELQRALACLSRGEQEVLALRFGEGLAFREIAERSGTSISTLHSRAEAALGKLRRILGNRAGGAWRRLEDPRT